MDSFLNKYHIETCLQTRDEGSVLLCQRLSPRRRRRIAKIIEPENTKYKHRIYREPRFLNMFRGDDRVVQFYRSVDTTHRLYIILEYCEKGDLHDYFLDTPNIKKSWVKKTMMRLASIIQLLHTNGIAHRDIKLENFLIRGDGSICITDFGLSTVVADSKQNAAVGSHNYAPPELLMHYDGRVNVLKCDIYSLGVCFLILFFRISPFSEVYNVMIEQKKNFILPKCFIGAPLSLQLLLYRMLSPTPEYRPNIEDVVESEFFNK